ncbi:glycoside hydrolase family 25 protein [Algoriphagus sp.]|uniref:glycoside hydrolase family 25 protein n=1 Tax=Algoriphagus sp. TaxID=1872435 RepID=UPI0025ED1EA5|nr:glycoside hydrolase family 25 protein [Algoriphagus sp.]
MKLFRQPILLFLLTVTFTSCKKESEIEVTAAPEVKEIKDTVSKPYPKQILGIDVSHFQGDVNWEDIKKADITFVYDKATQGDSFLDPKYSKNKTGAHESGLAHGSYHFFTSNADAIKQAEFFVKSIDYGEGDLPPVLDLEEGGIKGTINSSDFEQEVLKWLTYVETNLGVKPIIYTNHTFGDKYLSSSDFAEYQLWIAEYGVETPKTPKIWDDKGWLIWQRSERGTIEGAIGQVDHDLYNPQKPFEVLKK